MAAITRVDASSLAGAALVFSAATVTTGDTLVGGQSVKLFVNNASGSSINATLTTPENIEGTLAVADRIIAVAAGAIREIPVPSRYNDPVTGLATVICSAVVTVTLAASLGTPQP